MQGDLDAYDFVLAERLHKTLGEVRAMPNSEIVVWRAWDTYRNAMRELASKEPG